MKITSKTSVMAYWKWAYFRFVNWFVEIITRMWLYYWLFHWIHILRTGWRDEKKIVDFQMDAKKNWFDWNCGIAFKGNTHGGSNTKLSSIFICYIIQCINCAMYNKCTYLFLAFDFSAVKLYRAVPRDNVSWTRK